jgi:hypothetical protein
MCTTFVHMFQQKCIKMHHLRRIGLPTATTASVFLTVFNEACFNCVS